ELLAAAGQADQGLLHLAERRERRQRPQLPSRVEVRPAAAPGAPPAPPRGIRENTRLYRKKLFKKIYNRPTRKIQARHRRATPAEVIPDLRTHARPRRQGELVPGQAVREPVLREHHRGRRGDG